MKELQAAPRKRVRKIIRPPEATSVQLTRITVIETGEESGDPLSPKSARAVIDRALHSQAIAATGHRHVTVTPEPIGLRQGIGRGAEVAESEWYEAEELAVSSAPKKGRRRPAPTEEKFAQLLGGRQAIPASALLALRARQDLEAGRTREAALQLEAAITTASVELGGVADEASVEALVAHAVSAAAAAEAARAGELDEEALDAVTIALERLEQALRKAAASHS
ncbi:MAG: hypothetical protein NTX07_00795 [Solirubrobacterales bacterium]|nr:hypothetical protein [Solirubrobacterales bacterium]